MTQPERVLKTVLRVSGTVSGLAIFAVFMPRSWMDATHKSLGLGDLPQGIIVDYLARSLSAMYAHLGGLQWVVSFDVRRHASVITYMGWAGIVFSVVILVIDIQLGLPLSWTLSEGPVVFAVCVVILALLAKTKASSASSSDAS